MRERVVQERYSNSVYEIRVAPYIAGDTHGKVYCYYGQEWGLHIATQTTTKKPNSNKRE
jgi:hypothetical protein